MKQLFNHINRYLVILVLGLLMISSCKKTAGEGGGASIKGKLWMQDWNNSFTFLESEYAAFDEDVYIIYGDDISYSQRIRSSYNGEFEFKYLRRGKYKIYFYSDDSTMQSSSGKVAVVKEVEIKKNNEQVDLGTTTIFK